MLICKHQISPSLEPMIYLSLSSVFFTYSSSTRDILQRILQRERSFPQSGIVFFSPSCQYFSSLTLRLMLEPILFYKLKFILQTLKLESLGNRLWAGPWHCHLLSRAPGFFSWSLIFRNTLKRRRV